MLFYKGCNPMEFEAIKEVVEEIPFDFAGIRKGLRVVTKEQFICEAASKAENQPSYNYQLEGLSGWGTAFEICKILNIICRDGRFFRKKVLKIANLDALSEVKDTRIDHLETENREMRAELLKMKAALADTLDLLQSVARAR